MTTFKSPTNEVTHCQQAHLDALVAHNRPSCVPRMRSRRDVEALWDDCKQWHSVCSLPPVMQSTVEVMSKHLK